MIYEKRTYRMHPGKVGEFLKIYEENGVAIITVPHFNSMRRLKARWGCYRGEPRDLAFYQYAFQRDEICKYLTDAGFEVVQTRSYGGFKGIRDEIPFTYIPMAVGLRTPIMRGPAQQWLGSTPLGHMLAMICRKP